MSIPLQERRFRCPGRFRSDDRAALDGILYVARTAIDTVQALAVIVPPMWQFIAARGGREDEGAPTAQAALTSKDTADAVNHRSEQLRPPESSLPLRSCSPAGSAWRAARGQRQ